MGGMNLPVQDRSRPVLTWRMRLMLLAFGLTIAILFAEGGLRVAEAMADPAAAEGWGSVESRGEYWAIPDPDLGYRQNPRFADLNSDGLRDPPIGPKANRFRVLMLGDSLAVYGDSVDDTFVGEARAALASDPSFAGVHLINAGIKGYTNYQEVAYLRKYGVEFEPDSVGFAFCLNDLFKFLHSFEIENGKLVPGTYQFSTEAVAGAPQRWWIRLARQSRLLVWLQNNLSVVRSAAQWGATQGFSFDHRLDVRPAWQDAPWQAIETQLGEAALLGRERGFSVFVLAFPLAVQYDTDYLVKDREYVLKPQRKLREICMRLGLPFYDLYGDLGAGHFIDDGLHLTAEGRRVAGGALAGFLSKSGLIRR
jgi:lysophospholipase L1-like esterase